MIAIPAILEDFIPDARTLKEDWRYTNIADILRDNPLKQLSTHVEYHIDKDTTMPLQFTGGYPSATYHVAEGVKLNLIASFQAAASGPLPSLSLARVRLNIAKGAQVNHIRFTHYDAGHSNFAQVEANVAEEAQYQVYALTTGAQRLRPEFKINLLGERASANIAYAYVLSGNAHHNLQLTINHLAPNTRSNQYIKGVVRDTARGAFQGKIHVARHAQNTEAYQLHRALQLSERAEVNAKPELEIYADQVKCTHGNTVGALDEGALFFMQQRGIPLNEARQMLTRAFIAETLDYVPTLRDEIRDGIAGQLDDVLTRML